jgi:hypothetical protein
MNGRARTVAKISLLSFMLVAELEMYLRAGSLLLIFATTAFLVSAAPDPARADYDLVNEDVVVDPTTVSGIPRITIRRLVNASWTLCDAAAARWDINPAPVHVNASDYSIGVLGFDEPTGNFVNCRITVCGGRLGRIVAATTGGGLVNCSISIVDVVFVGLSSTETAAIIPAVNSLSSRLAALRVTNAIFNSTLLLERNVFEGFAPVVVNSDVVALSGNINAQPFFDVWWPTAAIWRRYANANTNFTSVAVTMRACIFRDVYIDSPFVKLSLVDFSSMEIYVFMHNYGSVRETVYLQPFLCIVDNVMTNISARHSVQNVVPFSAMDFSGYTTAGVVDNNTIDIVCGSGYQALTMFIASRKSFEAIFLAPVSTLSRNRVYLRIESTSMTAHTGVHIQLSRCGRLLVENNSVSLTGTPQSGLNAAVLVTEVNIGPFGTITIRDNSFQARGGYRTVSLRLSGMSTNALPSTALPSQIAIEGNVLVAARESTVTDELLNIMCVGIYVESTVVFRNISAIEIRNNTINIPVCRSGPLAVPIASYDTGGTGIFAPTWFVDTTVIIVDNIIEVKNSSFSNGATLVTSSVADMRVERNIWRVHGVHSAIGIQDASSNLAVTISPSSSLLIRRNIVDVQVDNATRKGALTTGAVAAFVSLIYCNVQRLQISENVITIADDTPHNMTMRGTAGSIGVFALHLSLVRQRIAEQSVMMTALIDDNVIDIRTYASAPTTLWRTVGISVFHVYFVDVSMARNSIRLIALPGDRAISGYAGLTNQQISGVHMQGAFFRVKNLNVTGNNISVSGDSQVVSGIAMLTSGTITGARIGDEPEAVNVSHNDVVITMPQLSNLWPSYNEVLDAMAIARLLVIDTGDVWLVNTVSVASNALTCVNHRRALTGVSAVVVVSHPHVSVLINANRVNLFSNHNQSFGAPDSDAIFGLWIETGATVPARPGSLAMTNNEVNVSTPHSLNVYGLYVGAISHVASVMIQQNRVSVAAALSFHAVAKSMTLGIYSPLEGVFNVSHVVIDDNTIDVVVAATAALQDIPTTNVAAVELQMIQCHFVSVSRNHVTLLFDADMFEGNAIAVWLHSVTFCGDVFVQHNDIFISNRRSATNILIGLHAQQVHGGIVSNNTIVAKADAFGYRGLNEINGVSGKWLLPLSIGLWLQCADNTPQGTALLRHDNNTAVVGPQVSAIGMLLSGNASGCANGTQGNSFSASGSGFAPVGFGDLPAAVAMWIALTSARTIVIANSTLRSEGSSVGNRTLAALMLDTGSADAPESVIVVQQSIIDVICNDVNSACSGVQHTYAPTTGITLFDMAVSVRGSVGASAAFITTTNVRSRAVISVTNSVVVVQGFSSVAVYLAGDDTLRILESNLTCSSDGFGAATAAIVVATGRSTSALYNCTVAVSAALSARPNGSIAAVLLVDGRSAAASGAHRIEHCRASIGATGVSLTERQLYPVLDADSQRSSTPRVPLLTAANPTSVRLSLMLAVGMLQNATLTVRANEVHAVATVMNTSASNSRLALLDVSVTRSIGLQLIVERNTANFTFGRQGIAPSVALDPIARRRYVDGALLIYDAATDAQLQAFVSLNRLDAVPSLPLMILGRDDAACALSRRCASQRPQAMPPFNVTVSCNELGDRAADATDVVVVSGTAAGWNASTSASALAATGDLNVLNGVRIGVGLRMVPCSVTSTPSRSRSLSSDESSTATYLPSRTASTVPSASQSTTATWTPLATATVSPQSPSTSTSLSQLISQSQSSTATYVPSASGTTDPSESATHSTSPTLTPPRTPTPSLTTSISATQVPAVMAAVDAATGRDTLRAGGGWLVLNGLAGPAVMGFNVTLLGGEDGQRAVTESFAAGGCEAVVALEAQADILTAFTAAADADRVPELSAEVGTPNATSRASLIRTASASEATASVITRDRSQHRDALTALLTPLFTSEEDVWTSTQASTYRLVDMTARVVTASQPTVTNAFVAFSPMIVDDSVNSGANATREQLSSLTGRAFRLQITFPPTCFARRSRGVAMTTFVAFAPPAPPPPPPPQVVVPSAAVIVATISSGAGGAVGGAASAAIAARSNAILLLGSCEFDEAEDEQAKAEEARIERFSTGAQTGPEDSAGDNVADGDVDVVDGPLRLRVLGSNAVGAGVGNAILLLALTVLHAVAARARLWMRQRSGESLPSQVTTGLAGLDVAMVRWPWLRFAALSGSLARLPSLESVAFMFLLGPTVSLLVACLAAPAPSEASASAVSGQTAVALAVLLLFAALSVAVGAVLLRDPFPAVFIREEDHLLTTSARHSVRQRLESFLRGAGEWEDRTTRRDAAEDALRSAALGGKRCKAAHFSFVRAFGLMFIDYLPERRWWLVVEVATTWAVSIVDGLIKAGYCGAGQGWALAVIMTANVVATMVFRPLEAYHNHVFTVTLSGAQALATVSLATALSLRNNNATVTSAGAAAARTLFRISEMVMLIVTILTTLRMVYDGARAAAAMISSRYKRARLRYSMEQAVAVGIVTDSADAELDRLLIIAPSSEHENMGGLLVLSNTQHPQRTDLRSPANLSASPERSATLHQPLLHETRGSVHPAAAPTVESETVSSALPPRPQAHRQHETRQSSDTQRLLERSLDLLDDLERQMEHLRDTIQRTTALEREVALREASLRRGYL